MRVREGERGAALLTVLLLVAVISVMAATALEKLRLSTRLAGNAASVGQARAYAQAAEAMATVRIDGLLSQARDRVSLAGGWSGRPHTLPVPGGIATARVTDGTNCFNLNSLVSGRGQGNYAAYSPGAVQFARLMRLVSVPASLAGSIAASATDWIDSDDQELPGGAEDAAYQGREVPYRTAGTLMTDPSELRAVAGVTPQIYAALRPWVCTLPVTQPTEINVDTLAPEQAPLLAMLLPETAGVGQAQALLLTRPPLGWSGQDFDKALSTSGLASAGAARQQMVVKTRWFSLRVDVVLNGAELHERGLIDAFNGTAQLVSREWGEAG